MFFQQRSVKAANLLVFNNLKRILISAWHRIQILNGIPHPVLEEIYTSEHQCQRKITERIKNICEKIFVEH